MTGEIWVCDICGKQCKSLEEKEAHVEETEHKIFTIIIKEESKLIWVCSTCGVNCLSISEKELHVKETGHRLYTPCLADGSNSTGLGIEVNKLAEMIIPKQCNNCGITFSNKTDDEFAEHVENCEGAQMRARVTSITDDVMNEIADRVVKKLIERLLVDKDGKLIGIGIE